MLADLPSVWFVLWGNAVLAERVSLDDGAEGISGPTARHRVLTSGWTHNDVTTDPVPPPGAEPGETTLAVALGRLRASGVRRLSLALPVPGDPLGLGGPATFTAAAVAAGDAVLVPDSGLGLVPTTQPADGKGATAVRWDTTSGVQAAEPGESLGAAESALRLALLDAAAELTALDVAAGTERPRRSSAPRRRLPPGTDGRAAHLLETADRMLDTVAAALADDGGAVSASQAAHRRSALSPLERAARRAVVAACALSYAEPRTR